MDEDGAVRARADRHNEMAAGKRAVTRQRETEKRRRALRYEIGDCVRRGTLHNYIYAAREFRSPPQIDDLLARVWIGQISVAEPAAVGIHTAIGA